MSEYDQAFDLNILIGHCDLISQFSDFALYLDTQLVYFHTFYTPPLKKVRGIMLYPPKKNAFECPSVRPSVCPSVRQRFVSGLYLEHLLTDFLQTLYRSSYQEGVVWD